MNNIKSAPSPPNILKEKWNAGKQCWEKGATFVQAVFIAEAQLKSSAINLQLIKRLYIKYK